VIDFNDQLEVCVFLTTFKEKAKKKACSSQELDTIGDIILGTVDPAISMSCWAALNINIDYLFKIHPRVEHVMVNVAGAAAPGISDKIWAEAAKIVKEGGRHMTMVETFKSDMKKASYRTAARKMNHLVRDFLVNKMADHAKVKGKRRDAFIANLLPFFESEMGSAMISLAIGTLVLPNVKMIVPQNLIRHVDILSEEFRVSGISMVQGEFLDMLTGPGLSMLNGGFVSALQGLASEEGREVTGVRVAADSNENVETRNEYVERTESERRAFAAA
jgi:hypothetical protein